MIKSLSTTDGKNRYDFGDANGIVNVIEASEAYTPLGDGRVIFTCELLIRGWPNASVPNKANTIRKRHNELARILEYADGDYPASVVVTFSTPIEYKRTAHVFRGFILPIPHPIVKANLDNGAALFTLSLEISENFKGRTSSATFSDISAFGGHAWYSKAFAGTGTKPSVIEGLVVVPTETNVFFDKFWIGFKPYYGPKAWPFRSYIHPWGARTHLGVDTNWQTGESAKDNGCIRCTFLTDTSTVERAKYPFRSWNKTTNEHYDKYSGNYKLLLTWTTTRDIDSLTPNIPSTYALRVRSGVPGRKVVGEIVEIQSQGHGRWHTSEIGYIEIPGDPSFFEISLDVGMIDGNPGVTNFFMGDLMIIPDEYGAVIGSDDLKVGITTPLVAGTGSDGSLYAYVSGGTSLSRLGPVTHTDISATNFKIPAQFGLIVFACDRASSAGQEWTDKVNISIAKSRMDTRFTENVFTEAGLS